eukprot:XP_001690430.1 predicted protein [Chlamydomonas reinhardtii]
MRELLQSNAGDAGLSTGAAIGIALGVLGGVLVITAVLVYFYKRYGLPCFKELQGIAPAAGTGVAGQQQQPAVGRMLNSEVLPVSPLEVFDTAAPSPVAWAAAVSLGSRLFGRSGRSPSGAQHGQGPSLGGGQGQGPLWGPGGSTE